LAREVLAICEKDQPGNWNCHVAMSLLGDALMGQQKYTDAEPLLIGGYEGLKRWEAKLDMPWSWRLNEALQRLVRFYEATNQPVKAAAWRKRLPPEVLSRE
jgi:hypothetical protein